MGVDIAAYRCRIGTFRHRTGMDVVLLKISVNYSGCLKMAGTVICIAILLLMAGIESNPGPTHGGLVMQADRFQDKRYCNWLKVGLSLVYMKEGLEGFAEKQSISLHTNIQATLLQQGRALTVIPCTRCTLHGLRKIARKWTFKNPCLVGVCDAWIDEIVKYHINRPCPDVSWDNTNPQLWPTDPWEVAKVFQPYGCKGHSSPSDCDAAAILTLMKNCTHFRQFVSNVALLQDIQEIRNKTMHTKDMLVDDTAMIADVNTVIQLLQDQTHLTHLFSCQEAVRKIEEIRKADFTISWENELHVLGDAVNAFKVKQSEHEDHVKQMIQDHRTYVDEKIRQSVLKTNKQISEVKTDLATRMTTMDKQRDKQLKQIAEVDAILRKVNTILDTKRESTQLIKTDMEHIRQKNESIHKLISEEQNNLKAAMADISDRLSALTSDHEKTQIRVATIESENTETKQRVDTLESKQPLADSKHISEEDTASLRQFLVNMYADYVDLVPLSPLCRDEGLPIHQIYTPVIVEEDMFKGRHAAGRSDCKRITSYRELFYQDSVLSIHTFMVGSAGRGKTTYCVRMLDDWRNGKKKQSSQDDSVSDGEKDMLDFEYVFFISLRNVDNSDTAIVDMIFNQLLFEHPKYKDTVMHVLETSPNKCLVILDGLDEWSPSQEVCHKLREPGLPNRDGLYGCPTFVTSRPWKLEALRTKISHSSKLVNIKGIGEKEVESLVRMVLIKYCGVPKESKGFPQTINDFLKKSGKGILKHLLEIPLITTWLVTLWHESGTLDDSLTGVYVRLTECLIKKSEREGRLSKHILSGLKPDNRLDVLQNKCTLSEHTALLLSLGELAFDSLTQPNMNLVFPKDELEKKIGNEQLEVSLKIGLTCQSKVPGKNNTKYVSVSFFHKTMQEFLAALWLVFAADKPFDILSTLCTDMLTLRKMSNIIVFASGLDSKLGCRLSQHIVHVMNGDEDILDYRLHPSTYNISFDFVIKPVYAIQCDCFLECIQSKKANRDGFQVSDVVFSSSNMEVSTNIMSSNCSNIKSIDIDLSFDEDINSDTHRTFYSLLSRMEKIQRITIRHKSLTNDSLIYLTNLSKTLRCLCFDNVCFEECGVLPDMLHTLHNVTDLGLYDLSMPYKSFDDLMSYLQVSDITVLELGKIRFSDQTMIDNRIDLNLSQYHNLQHISLVEMNITDLDLSNNHNLGYLSLRRMTIPVVHIPVDSIQTIILARISGSVLELLQQLPQCSQLISIDVIRIDNDEAHVFASLVPKLTHLDYIYLVSVNMTATDWAQVVDSLVSKQHMRHVDLRYTNIDEVSVSRLSSAPNVILNEGSNYLSEVVSYNK